MASLKSQISILGCGWLGLPLAEALVDRQYTVKGSTTKKEKLGTLSAKGISPYLFHATREGLEKNKTFFNTDLLYINIPPGRRRENVNEIYPNEIERIIKTAADGEVKRIVFISSTGVYPNNNQVVTEQTLTPSASSGSSDALLRAEALVKNCNIDWTIIRMAGLAGPNREPGKWFTGKKDIPNGLAPVNMIHLEDAVGISIKVIENRQSIGQIYNACSDRHPTKIEFYQAQAAKLNLDKPQFVKELRDYKIVKNDKIKKAFNYLFIYPNPCQF